MAKRCPTCGRVFPDTAKHCDADATPLQAERPWYASRWLIAAGMVVLCGGLLLLVFPYAAGAIARRVIPVSLYRVDLPRVTRVEEKKLQIAQGAAGAHVEFNNVTRLSRTITGVSLDLLLGGTKIGAGRHSKAIVLAPRTKRLQTVKIEIDAAAFAAATLAAYAEKARTTIGVRGAIRLKLGRFEFSVPVASTLELEVTPVHE